MLEVVYHRCGVGSISVGDAVILDGKGFARSNKAYLQGLDNTKVLSKSGGQITVPATMSKVILSDLLKGKLGFDGVIISDAMDMDAISKQFEMNDAVIKTIAAGADIILMPVPINCPDDVTQLDELYRDIKLALKDGQLSEERLNDAAVRVIKLKIEKGILDRNYDADLNELIFNAREIVGCREHRQIEREIAAKCVDIRFDGDFIAFTPSDSDKIVCVMPRAGEMFSAGHSFQRMKSEGLLPDAATECYNYEAAWSEGAEPDQELIEAVGSADYIILGFLQTPESMKDGYIRNTVFDEILNYAKTDKIAIIWEYLPYKTEKYNSNYPCFVIYNSVGMTEKDIGAEIYTDKYGPAIPAAMEKIFGKG